jgi:hypothetical protein
MVFNKWHKTLNCIRLKFASLKLMYKQQLADKHSFVKDTIFRFKVFLLIVQRSLINLSLPVNRFKYQGDLVNDSIISFSESDLWNFADNKENWILTAGKIENLRIAVKKIKRSRN